MGTGRGRLASAALALGLLFAWLLSVPLSGPVLARSSAPGLGALTAAEAFALAHGLSLLALGLWSLRGPLPGLCPWAGPVTAALGLLLAAAPTGWWPPLLLLAGATSAAAVLVVACSIARLPGAERPWAIALGALLANVPLYVAALPEAPLPDRPLAAALALGPLMVPLLLPRAAGEEERAQSSWWPLPALVPAAFATYLVGGLMYSLVLPTLGGLGLHMGVLPYMALLPLAAWAAVRWGWARALRPGPALLGLGFVAWALAGGGSRELAAQGLVVGGYAFLDVPLWGAFADGRRPPVSLGLGLGAMVTAIFAGMALGERWAAAAQGREEEVALAAAACLLLAALVLPAWTEGREGSAAPAAAPASPDGLGLSRREAQVLSLAVRGLSNKEIAVMTGLSGGTVRKVLERAYRKLGVRGRLEAAALLNGRGRASDGDGGGISRPSRAT
ncbi:Putative HTH-type transcriptional regulator YhjB [bacterium HR24]|nr:Putative HTH-type transcriptional regulator YhjB [bacterium HR24]